MLGKIQTRVGYHTYLIQYIDLNPKALLVCILMLKISARRLEWGVKQSGPRGSVLHDYVKSANHPNPFGLDGLSLPNLKGVLGRRDHRSIPTGGRSNHRAHV